MTANLNSQQPAEGESWKVLRNFQSGPESFREGETLSLIGTNSETGELTFRGEGGVLKSWGLKRGLVDYSGVVFSRGGGNDL